MQPTHAAFRCRAARRPRCARGGGLQSLRAICRRKQAMELVLTSRRITAAEAVRIGLSNGAVPAAQLQDHVRSIAAMIVENAPLASKRRSK